jgi:hypothetical protein
MIRGRPSHTARRYVSGAQGAARQLPEPLRAPAFCWHFDMDGT